MSEREIAQKKDVIEHIVQEKDKVIKLLKDFFPHDSERKLLLLATGQGDLSMGDLSMDKLMNLHMTDLLSIFQMLEEKKIFLIMLNHLLNGKYEVNAENLKKVKDSLLSWKEPKTPIFYYTYTNWRDERENPKSFLPSDYWDVEKKIVEATKRFVKQNFVKKPTRIQKAFRYITSPFSRKDHVSEEDLKSRNAIIDESDESPRLSKEEITKLEAARKEHELTALYDKEGRAAGGTAKAKKRSRKITKKRNKKSKSKRNKSKRK